MMPGYTYKCESCEHIFDVVQRITDDPLQECPKCSKDIRKVLYPVGFALKGNGWYQTDFKDSKKVDTT